MGLLVREGDPEVRKLVDLLRGKISPNAGDIVADVDQAGMGFMSLGMRETGSFIS